MTAHTPAKDLIPTLGRNVSSAFAPLQRELNRFFDDLGDSLNVFPEGRFAPRMDVMETKDGLDVTIEVPGLSQDQVKVTVEDDVLTVSGEKSEIREKSEGSARLTERSYGQFARSIYLPRSIEAAKIQASMKDGVLKLQIPKRPGAETKTIEIQSK